MKNRRIIIAAFLCCAMLLVGVGYAALTAHLTVEGSGNYNMDAAVEGLELDLIFSEPKVIASGTAKSNTVEDVAEVTTDAAGKSVASFTVNTLAVLDDEAVFEYVLTNTNASDVTLNISPTHDNGKANPTYVQDNFYEFTALYVYADEAAVAAGNGTDILADASNTVDLVAGDSVVIRVHVKLNSIPSQGNITNEQFYLHISATHS